MMKEMSEGGMMDPNSQVQKEKQRSKRGPLDTTMAKERKKQQRKKAKQARKKNRKRR
jgi:signal recognition particle subunit SRP54